MIYYFAAAYERQAELRGYRDDFQTKTGHEVSSRWLDNPQGGFVPTDLNADPERCWEQGKRDIQDIVRSQALVSFTGQGTRGGRHVEHGMAMELHARRARPVGPGFRLIVVGPREVIFHTHPDTEIYPDFAAFLDHEIAERLWG
jgi:hypothetical protein